MIIKVNGNPISPITTHGIDIKYDFKDIAVDAYQIIDKCDIKDLAVDAYHVIHTPVNVDLSYAGHNIITGDVNTFNWAQAAIKSGFHLADHIIGSIF